MSYCRYPYLRDINGYEMTDKQKNEKCIKCIAPDVDCKYKNDFDKPLYLRSRFEGYSYEIKDLDRTQYGGNIGSEINKNHRETSLTDVYDLPSGASLYNPVSEILQRYLHLYPSYHYGWNEGITHFTKGYEWQGTTYEPQPRNDLACRTVCNVERNEFGDCCKSICFFSVMDEIIMRTDRYYPKEYPYPCEPFIEKMMPLYILRMLYEVFNYALVWNKETGKSVLKLPSGNVWIDIDLSFLGYTESKVLGNVHIRDIEICFEELDFKVERREKFIA